MITRRFLDWINRMIERGNPPKTAMLGELDLVPTQSDKPSNHSSHDLMKTYRKNVKDYPQYKGYKVSTVANTNSMEPLFDANSVLILEELTGMWKYRLEEQPFKPGQIVTYDTTRGSIIHVLKTPTTFLGKPAWILQGTNNFLPDMTKVLESQITTRKYGQFDCKQIKEGD